jgi:hypothetical protein
MRLLPIDLLQGGLYPDSREQMQRQDIRDCPLEIESPYNRSKDALMCEFDDRSDFRAPQKLDFSQKYATSEIHSPFKQFINLMPTWAPEYST